MRLCNILLALVSLLVCSSVLAFYPSPRGVSIAVSQAPSNDLQLTVDAIMSAKHSVYSNIYELTSPEVADAFLNRIQAGVHVEILEEGEPYHGISPAGRGIQLQLAKAMRKTAPGKDHFFEMRTSPLGTRRFNFDHAKYTVIDEQSVLVGSENFSPTGQPQPGSVGNRGWQVLIQDPATAQQFITLFRRDATQEYADVVDLVKAQIKNFDQVVDKASQASGKLAGKAPILKHSLDPIQSFPAESVGRITSPDTSLSGLLALIRGAQRSIDIEQMTFDSSWTWGTNQENPLIQAIKDAVIKNHVRVRILLNDDSAFGDGAETGTGNGPKRLGNAPSEKTKLRNAITVKNFMDWARKNNKPVQALIANVEAMGVDYIHNKGMLIDDDKTLVSSINWNFNAITNNREVGVLLVSRDVHDHYEQLFESDWQASLRGRRTMAFHLVEDQVESEGPHDSNANRRKRSQDCPEKLHVSADVGPLSVPEPLDRSFQIYAGKHLEQDFTRDDDDPGCTLESPEQEGTGSRMYLQIRDRNDGFRKIEIEGYTPDSKLYSLRIGTKRAGSWGRFTGFFWDGSGPNHNRLGQVVINLSERPVVK